MLDADKERRKIKLIEDEAKGTMTTAISWIIAAAKY
jgi:hypothetical protein